MRRQFELTGLGYQFLAYPVLDGQRMDSFMRKRLRKVYVDVIYQRMRLHSMRKQSDMQKESFDR
jgi:hypothetical protein